MSFAYFIITILFFAAADPIQLPSVKFGKKCIDSPNSYAWSYIWVYETNTKLTATKDQCHLKKKFIKNGIDVKPK
ncbi:MAG: hypothetical protein CMI90_06905 [Pelagibacteraceae bacterium]|jgi:hypothetical protein|nr:hypothetical protein [Pelagibacteraceae bacterium]|tara:strand:+ start:1010 stop:1234 length:225 start_codon:yes stop_codon:yes gene_type:complete